MKQVTQSAQAVSTALVVACAETSQKHCMSIYLLHKEAEWAQREHSHSHFWKYAFAWLTIDLFRNGNLVGVTCNEHVLMFHLKQELVLSRKAVLVSPPRWNVHLFRGNLPVNTQAHSITMLSFCCLAAYWIPSQSHFLPPSMCTFRETEWKQKAWFYNQRMFVFLIDSN